MKNLSSFRISVLSGLVICYIATFFCHKDLKDLSKSLQDNTDLENYYNEIKKMLNEEVSPVLIVTDSLKDAKHFFSEMQNTYILSSKNALEDFKHLISTEKLYCAPSTFSWWAAHSLSPDSEVIIPKLFENNLGIFVKSKKLIII